MSTVTFDFYKLSSVHLKKEEENRELLLRFWLPNGSLITGIILLNNGIAKSWDQIPLSWNNILKFSLEMASILSLVAPITVFLWTDGLIDRMLATILCLSVSLVSLIIMQIVEEEMYEVLRGIRKGRIWYNLR